MQIERVDLVDVPTRDMPFCEDPDGNSLILHRRDTP
jgi:hypothetical protein